MKEHNLMNVISLFSGCGGLDLGFERAGFNIPVANERYAHSILFLTFAFQINIDHGKRKPNDI